ncbi:MAG: YqiA/YcfP family alpha/beta fold hydrolase [Oceanococcus sp.]
MQSLPPGQVRKDLMKVYFSHGKESGPWGTKIKRLAETAKRYGCEVVSLDYTSTVDPDERVNMLLDHLATDKPEQYCLVGSSMGGYASFAVASQMACEGVFAMAPALRMPGYKQQDFVPKTENVEIVHGWEDEVIPVEHSCEFAQSNGFRLHLVPDDHRLNSSLDELEHLFAGFLERLGCPESNSNSREKFGGIF